MAGVINIVFPNIDRPVFAWADVSATSPGTTEMNLTLGGKAGGEKVRMRTRQKAIKNSGNCTLMSVFIPRPQKYSVKHST